MKKQFIAAVAALSLAGTVLAGEMETTSVTTTTGAGTITSFTPGSSLVVRTEAAEPVTYHLGKKVTYVTTTGDTIEPSMITSGMPVTVHYVKEGSNMVADRVVVDKTTTTTTTTTH